MDIKYRRRRLRHAGRADTFHFSQCINPHQVRCTAYRLRPSSGSPEPSGADTQDFYFWRMPEHNAAIKLNLARSRQEVKRQNNKQHPVTFQNKTLCVDISIQISKKRQTQGLHWPFGREHFMLLFLITQTYNCGFEWLCDCVIIAETPWPRDTSCLLYCAMADSNHNWWGLPDGGRCSKTRSEPQRSGPYPVEIVF